MRYLLGISKELAKADPEFLKKLKARLRQNCADLTVTKNLTSALSYATIEPYSAIFLDWSLLQDHYQGFSRRLRRQHKQLPINIFFDGNVIGSELCGKNEALFSLTQRKDFLTALPEINTRLVEYFNLIKSLPGELRVHLNPNGFGRFIGNSLHILDIYHQVARVATTDFTVMILGESGTGKELVARSVHDLSSRSGNTFVSLNCAAIPEHLLESELFGYEKGAFTGANSAKPGMFELADKSTIFLDEIGDMALDLQAKLLRVLEDHRVQRLGSTTTKTVDIRVIAATNMRLEELIADGKFREDLYHRLNVIPIRLLPLNQRREDIPLLTLSLLGNYLKDSVLKMQSISADLIEEIQDLPLRGNVRELGNLLTRIIFYSKGPQLEKSILLEAVYQRDKSEPTDHTGNPAVFGDAILPLTVLEQMAIEHALNLGDKNISRIAGELGISRTALYRKMKIYGLQGHPDD